MRSCKRKALKILLESRGEQEPTVAKVYKGMGECYRKKGNPLKSLEYFEKALKISVAVFGEKHSNNAYIYAAMGILYLESNDAEKGLEYLEKALAVIIECRGSEHADAKTIQEIIDSIKNPASTSGGSESTQESADPQAPAPTPAPAPAPAPAEISSGDDLIEAIRRQLDPDYSGGRSSSGRSSAPAAPAPVSEVQTPQPPASSTNASGISGQVDGVINNRRNPSTPPASRNQRSLIDEVQQAL